MADTPEYLCSFMDWYHNEDASPFKLPKLNVYGMVNYVKKYKYCNMYISIKNDYEEVLGYILGYTPRFPILSKSQITKLTMLNMKQMTLLKDGKEPIRPYDDTEKDELSKRGPVSYDILKNAFWFNGYSISKRPNIPYGFIQYIYMKNDDILIDLLTDVMKQIDIHYTPLLIEREYSDKLIPRFQSFGFSTCGERSNDKSLIGNPILKLAA
jgi:hypothetical protein